MTSPTWRLEYLEHDMWINLGLSRSGDEARVKARRHQLESRDVLGRYRIFDPGGNVWLYGVPTYTARGLRMSWRSG